MKNDIIAIEVSEDYIRHIDRLLERSKLELFEWFEKPSEKCKVKTYIYKDITSLRTGLKRRYNKEYPPYMVACMVDEEENIHRCINLYEPPITSEESYSRKEYNIVVFHELIHYITDLLYGKLPEWLTEGIAVYLDGSYKNDLPSLINKINTYQIPSISDMKEDTFVLEDESGNKLYDGYELSYIMIRYIIETLGKDYLFSLMKNKKQIKLVEQTTLTDAIEYFNCQYLEEKSIKNLNI
jgi:hypothetical protein